MTWKHPDRSIVVDFGHGGDDPGATVEDPKHGYTTEVQVIDAVGARIFERLKNRVTMRTYRTRTSPATGLSMSKRVDLVNRRTPHIVLSIHANVSTRSSTRGMWLVYDDNTDERGVKLSGFIRDALVSAGFQVPVVTPDNTGYVGGRELAILGNTTAPACLIELGFMTNPADLDMLLTHVNAQADIAESIEYAVCDYFDWLSKRDRPTVFAKTLEERVSDLEAAVARLSA